MGETDAGFHKTLADLGPRSVSYHEGMVLPFAPFAELFTQVHRKLAQHRGDPRHITLAARFEKEHGPFVGGITEVALAGGNAGLVDAYYIAEYDPEYTPAPLMQGSRRMILIGADVQAYYRGTPETRRQQFILVESMPGRLYEAWAAFHGQVEFRPVDKTRDKKIILPYMQQIAAMVR